LYLELQGYRPFAHIQQHRLSSQSAASPEHPKALWDQLADFIVSCLKT
jgi:hypothetical protein